MKFFRADMVREFTQQRRPVGQLAAGLEFGKPDAGPVRRDDAHAAPLSGFVQDLALQP